MAQATWSSALGSNSSRSNESGNNNQKVMLGRVKGEEGEHIRLVIPSLNTKTSYGETVNTPVIESVPVHRIDEEGFIDTGFPAREVRCIHPYSNSNDMHFARYTAENEDFCPLCRLVSMENQAFFNAVDKEFGSIKAYKELSKEEKIAFKNKVGTLNPVREAYNASSGIISTHQELLVYVLSTVTGVSEKQGNKIVTTALVDADGEVLTANTRDNVVYTPMRLKVTRDRMELFQKAINNAIENDLLSEDLTALSKDATTNVAWVDFELVFPEKATDAMALWSNLEIKAVPTKRSAFTYKHDLKEAMLSGEQQVIADFNRVFMKANRPLQLESSEAIIGAMADGGAYYRKMVAAHYNEKSREFEQRVFSNTIKSATAAGYVSTPEQAAANAKAAKQNNARLEAILAGEELPQTEAPAATAKKAVAEPPVDNTQSPFADTGEVTIADDDLPF